MNSELTTSPISQTRHRPAPDWRMTVRFRCDEDDDLIEHLTTLPLGHRATAIRKALHEAVRRGLAYDGHWSQSPRRDQPDARITVRFHYPEDAQVIRYLKHLPSRKRSVYVRQALRRALREEGAPPPPQEVGPAPGFGQ